MKIIFIFLSSAIILFGFGCKSLDWDSNFAIKRSLGERLNSYRAPSLEDSKVNDSIVTTSNKTINLTGSLSLNKALQVALLENPDLRIFSWQVRVAQAHALQQSLYPNPQVSLEIEGIGQRSDFDLDESTLGITQPILLAGKLDKRTRLAKLGSKLAGWDYETKRLEVFTAVTKNFIMTLAAQKRFELAKLTYELANQVTDAVSRQVEAGVVSSIELTRAQSRFWLQKIKKKRGARELKSARAQLAESIGITAPVFGKLDGTLKKIYTVPPLKILVGYIQKNPAIARFKTKLAERQAAINLENALAWPKVSAGAGIKRITENDELMPVIFISAELPLFDRNQGNILKARYKYASAIERKRAALVQLRSKLNQSYQKLKSAQESAQILSKQSLKKASQVYHTMRKAHAQGNRSLLDVLVAQRTLFGVQAQYIQALEDYRLAVAQVEHLIAAPLDIAKVDSSLEKPELQ